MMLTRIVFLGGMMLVMVLHENFRFGLRIDN
jgi:hypothetical protein